MTIAERILATIKGTDEGKVERFLTRTRKWINQQVSANNRAIEDLNDKLEDLKNEQADALVTVSKDNLASLASVKAYIPTYVQGIAAFNRNIADVNAKIDDLKDQNSKYEALLGQLSDSE